MAKIKEISNLGELRYLCFNGDNQQEYKRLAQLASDNLGGRNGTTEDHLNWLNTNAMETDEEGVVDEVNFCIDLV